MGVGMSFVCDSRDFLLQKNLYFNIRKNVIFKRQTNKPVGNIILVNKGIELYLFSVYFNIEGVTWCH